MVATKDLIIFDMDGVLVDVHESYRAAICATVEHFTGKQITRNLIQDYKNQGGWNNDWLLSQKMAADLGTAVEYQTVVDHFQKVFYGPTPEEGLMWRERWIANPGSLERLNKKFHFSIFTGRTKEEAQITLDRFAPRLKFQPLIGADEVKIGKPGPEGLELIQAQIPGVEYFYIGDTVDDARSASAAGMPFIGINHPGSLQAETTTKLLWDEGAIAVLDDINQLETFLCQ